ncbi:FAD/NAD(P)-binding protein [Dyadobacter subterraneus]|uniref:FAD/NAD(P)-binding protein n=1 Tax=Dyadobacter subterraneus TaxID=2773304 RepID=A0ABR9W806_9BACT|nr:FAD/NAD(P)-binding protein [Dyadobacter subterraneus]MBE9461590.1 FAD/NAD(P)-binding protein [Dyadobacter subterraneus]
MPDKPVKTRIAILGGGPSALFIYKRFVEAVRTDLEIHIFEAKKLLGAGMPYSYEGANREHVTNVSDNEIPEIVTSIETWIKTLSKESLAKYNIEKENFNEYKVLPRLLFGQYLSAQFNLLLEKAKSDGLATIVHLGSKVIDIVDKPRSGKVEIETAEKEILEFDKVIICTGHKWPVKYEGIVPGYFDSPYPPAKLELKLNHPIAIKGSSLTAVDALRTLARNNGTFETDKNGKVKFLPSKDSPDFKLVMHSRNGLLPAVRFHLEDPLVSNDSLLSPEEIEKNKAENDGFLSLDFVFEKEFKDLFKDKDPKFYASIKDLSMEEFVDSMMSRRESAEPFSLFKKEYEEAEKSIKRKESIYWKEVLAILSFAMNYPAKYLSAEDMQRLQKILMPLISVVIAFVPQSSCEELLALHDAGKLEIISVGETGEAEPEKIKGGITYHYTDENGKEQSNYFETFVDCVGQPHLNYEAFPFGGLLENKAISPARIKFRSPEKAKDALTSGNKNIEKSGNDYYLKVPGITINDNFQIVDAKGKENDRIYIMAVPYIGGYNPDYSGLDFCEQASSNIVDTILDV